MCMKYTQQYMNIPNDIPYNMTNILSMYRLQCDFISMFAGCFVDFKTK